MARKSIRPKKLTRGQKIKQNRYNLTKKCINCEKYFQDNRSLRQKLYKEKKYCSTKCYEENFRKKEMNLTCSCGHHKFMHYMEGCTHENEKGKICRCEKKYSNKQKRKTIQKNRNGIIYQYDNTLIATNTN